MPLLDLSLSTLGLLNNGTAEAIVNAALAAASLDVEDSGVGPAGDGKERSVTVTVTINGRPDGNVEVGLQASVKTPKYRIADTVAQVRMKNGKPILQFRDDGPGDPGQKTLNDFRDSSEVPNQE